MRDLILVIYSLTEHDIARRKGSHPIDTKPNQNSYSML